MDVHVKLALQGGHLWQFHCDEDDPILVGLVSALPGADTGGNLPADGLIQVEAHSGERLFLARSSLVSVEIRPMSAGLGATRRSVVPPSGLGEGVSGPAAFALMGDALPADVHRALLEDALAQAAAPSQSGPAASRELDARRVPTLERLLAELVARTRGPLGVPDLLETHLDLRLFAVTAGGFAAALEEATEAVLRLIFVFHPQPAKHTGGGVRLFDAKVENGVRRAADTFRDLRVPDNGALIYPGYIAGAALPLQTAAGTSAETLFLVRGALRQGLAGEG